MNKNKIMIIVLSIIILLIITSLLILGISPKKSTSEKVEDYLLGLGFKKEKDTTLYTKKVSKLSLDEYYKIYEHNNAEFEGLSFNVFNYVLTKNVNSSSDGIFLFKTFEYDYINNTIKFNEQINLDESNIIFEGEYVDDKNYKCEIKYSFKIDEDSIKNDICKQLKKDSKSFYEDAKMMIIDPELINEMKNKDNNIDEVFDKDLSDDERKQLLEE